MQILLHFISGVAFGLEYVRPESTDSGDHCIVLDIGIIRLMFFWEPKE